MNAAPPELDGQAETLVAADGYRTGDLMAPGCTPLGCQAMGEQLLRALAD